MTPGLAQGVLGFLLVAALLYLARENAGLARRVVALEAKTGGYPPMSKPLPPPPAPPRDWSPDEGFGGPRALVPVRPPKAPMARKRPARRKP